MNALERLFHKPEATTLTFDCYGTLVDWERGAIGALRDIYGYSEELVSQEVLIEIFLKLDAKEIRKNTFPYCCVLERVADQISEYLLGYAQPRRGHEFAESLSSWPVFEEIDNALAELALQFRLAIISNVDTDDLACTLKGINVPFDVVVTSEQSRSYKPDVAIFEKALERLGESPSKVIHVAEGLCEAIPATSLGMRSIWVRRSNRSDDGSGAIPGAIAHNLAEVVRASRGCKGFRS